jgi:hydrogen peroxide-dependent heme synthase
MSHDSTAQSPGTLVPEEGWHFLHLFYRVDRGRLEGMTAARREQGIADLKRILGERAPGGPEQLQCFAVPGHKADFGVIMAGPDLRAIHGIEASIQASSLGPALVPNYSFYSITEISEYVPDAEAYGRILREREGLDPESSMYQTKVKSYAERLGPMNRQRLYPEFPAWPCLCFYPMSKSRTAEQNWYMLPFETRSALMSQHASSGMKFAGRVTQLITASTGLDDWEWGVTLWARNPAYIKDIVYTMRFDESSARYGLFGDFYFGYILPPDELPGAIRL